jgi:phenylacetaldehyde dehydrogenase
VPLGQAIWKIAPALSTGCTLVLKPAEQTPLTALRLGQLIQEAGIPPGVINIVTGFGGEAGAALVDHPLVDKVAFTGSTETGRAIATRVASSMKRMTLELGGKSAMLVFDDADLETTIPGTAMGIFGNHGQNCCAGSRLYVQNGIYQELVEGIVKFADDIRLGPALKDDTDMGPLITREQQDRVLSYIRSGINDGAELLVGGHAVTREGAYVKPTVLGNVSQNMAVVQEEIFGPVLVVTPFDTAEQAISLANDTSYGLGASIWTQNLQNAHRLIPRLKSGTVWVNTHNVLDMAVPFGGVKASGIGRELGEEAVLHHTEVKTVTMAV